MYSLNDIRIGVGKSSRLSIRRDNRTDGEQKDQEGRFMYLLLFYSSISMAKGWLSHTP